MWWFSSRLCLSTVTWHYQNGVKHKADYLSINNTWNISLVGNCISFFGLIDTWPLYLCNMQTMAWRVIRLEGILHKHPYEWVSFPSSHWEYLSQYVQCYFWRSWAQFLQFLPNHFCDLKCFLYEVLEKIKICFTWQWIKAYIHFQEKTKAQVLSRTGLWQTVMQFACTSGTKPSHIKPRNQNREP